MSESMTSLPGFHGLDKVDHIGKPQYTQWFCAPGTEQRYNSLMTPSDIQHVVKLSSNIHQPCDECDHYIRELDADHYIAEHGYRHSARGPGVQSWHGGRVGPDDRNDARND